MTRRRWTSPAGWENFARHEIITKNGHFSYGGVVKRLLFDVNTTAKVGDVLLEIEEEEEETTKEEVAPSDDDGGEYVHGQLHVSVKIGKL